MMEPVRVEEGEPLEGEALDFLKRQPLVAACDEVEFELLASVVTVRRYEQGAPLLREHKITEALFIVYRGTVEVTKDADDLPDPDNALPDEYSITRLGAGSV